MSRVQTATPGSSHASAPPVQRWTRRHTLVLAAIIALAFGLRLAFWWGQSAHNPFFSHPTLDEQTHHELAQAVAEGRGVGAAPFFRAPLYYYTLGALYAAVGPNPAAARFLGCVLGTLACFLIARLGHALSGPAVGLIAGLIAAFYWPMIFFDNQLQTAGLEVFLDVLLLLLFIRGMQKGAWPLFLAAGVTWGLSAITRPNVLIVAPALLIALWAWPGERSSPLRRLRSAALLLAGAALVILPVTVRNRVVGGEWVLIASSGGVNFYIGNNPGADGRSAVIREIGHRWQGRFEDTQRLPEAAAGRKLTHKEVSAFWRDRALAWIRSDPAAWAGLMARKCRLFFSPLEIPNDHPVEYFANLSPVARVFWVGFPAVGVLGVAGLALLGRRVRTWLLPVLFLFSYSASIVLFFCPARFRLPVVPVLILLAAYGLWRAVTLISTRQLKPLAVYLVFGALAAVFIATNPPPRGALSREGEGMAHHQLGQLYARLAQQDHGLLRQAQQHLRQAVEFRPDDWTVRRSLGACSLQMGLTAEAYEQLSRAVQLSATDPDNHFYLGNCLQAMQKPDEAAEAYRRTLELLARTAAEPGYLSDLHHRFGLILAEGGEYSAAAGHFEEVRRRDPNHGLALLNLGSALTQMERYDEAAARFRQLLTREPANAIALRSLAHVLHKAGRGAEELAVLAEALRLAPEDASLAGLLAWRLATAPDAALRDGPRALAIIQQAQQRAGRPSAYLLQVLAAAHAECGRFDEAAAAAQRVLEMAQAAGRTEEAARIEAQLASYRAGRPLRSND